MNKKANWVASSFKDHKSYPKMRPCGAGGGSGSGGTVDRASPPLPPPLHETPKLSPRFPAF
ncbi:hypothetical protein E2C01_006842 [Portunus trituberculatus]|uniref:Uncharacterized protein n=1 Tax=Portunus trituberculatus TaxID=210409 RepID=A0A5B7CXE0_PORTR|nr:hypothetical protein [Portunus trituberculatus]